MAHKKGVARTKHKSECKAYRDGGIAARNKTRKAARRAKHLAKASARRKRREEASEASNKATLDAVIIGQENVN